MRDREQNGQNSAAPGPGNRTGLDAVLDWIERQVAPLPVEEAAPADAVRRILGEPVMFTKMQSYAPSLATMNTVDADVVTFESCSSGGIDLEPIGKQVTDKKIAIGVIDHHTLQVETPDQVAEQIRAALKFIPAERLVISSDCGMGREGMSRRHAFYKMVSLVLGTNMVRRELGLPEAPCLAADGRYSLTVTAR